MENIKCLREGERRSGAKSPKKALLSTPFRLLESAFSAAPSIPKLCGKRTTKQKCIVYLKVSCGYLKSRKIKLHYKNIEDKAKARPT